MPEIVKYSLTDALNTSDKTLTGSTSLIGRTGLGIPSYVNTNRAIMNTSHSNQSVVPIHPDFPRIFTNMENTVGKHSDGYYESDSDLDVFKKIAKFETKNHKAHLFLLKNKKP